MFVVGILVVISLGETGAVGSPAAELGDLFAPLTAKMFPQYAENLTAVAEFDFTDAEAGGFLLEDLGNAGGGD